MAQEDNKTRVQRVLNEAFTKGNLNALDELYAPNVVFHEPPRPDVVGLAAYKQMVIELRKAFSDIKFTFDEMITEGNTSASRWTFSGTHTGQIPGMPVPPTGKRVTINALSLVHLVNGKAVEEWAYMDVLGYMQQLGAAPPTGTAGK